MTQFKTIKQFAGSEMCMVCVAAMITNTTPEQVYQFLNDGRAYGSAMRDPEIAAYLLKYGYVMGANWAGLDGAKVEVNDSFIRTLGKTEAYLLVKSMTNPEGTHAVYWDGKTVRDPNPNLPDEMPLSEYEVIQVWPISFVSATLTILRLQMAPAEPPKFAIDWAESQQLSVITYE